MKINFKTYILVGTDIVIVWASVFTAYFLHFEGRIPKSHYADWLSYTFVSIAVSTIFMILFNLYKRVWRYSSIGELISIIKSVSLSSLLSFAITSIVKGQLLPVSLMLSIFETTLLLMGGVRFAWRIARDSYNKRQSSQRKALIIGAGDCGTFIAKELKFNRNSEMYPVVFIDDDPKKHKHQVLGIPVLGGKDQIGEVVERFQIDDIIIAIPSLSKRGISQLIDVCKMTKAKLKIIPSLDDLIHGKITIKEIRDVEVEDLLGREAVKVDLEGIANYVENKTVLITGAGGSIGSELCRQIAEFRPKQLLLLGHGENSIYSIEMELRSKYPQLELEPIIADVQDRNRIDDVFRTYSPEVVFHAAAHKHVPLMERNPAEAVKNNVLGTRNVADCADKYGTGRFVLISTDKAVNPTSIMGATKRIAEMYIQSLNHTSRTKYAAVRFGNVLGSRGSVIPRFKQQIESGGPVTVTHPDMIRYFMTIPEAVQLVIQAGSLANGGEVFVLDMGEPVKILNLAKDLIRLSGFEPNVDIPIHYTGIRPGEKLFEELLTNEEGLASTKHNRIFIGKPAHVNRSELEAEISKLEHVLRGNKEYIKDLIGHIVPMYRTVEQWESKELVKS
ncbi:polysaccharide biosynthesis protein [Paenibacillus ginsengarvi]|uniref:Polysaccharide biosynthesis protein n=1 Tax=Paenibacillus ginsengarvi TaxID=400777 RepID=A0A3B0CLC5_9BACL|nr:nucleoside-diphosphate sugar epimerase/dehydratase [Paenibacillus ginsengarvi]RKN85661.1 polysaccharide biosynthesis protein [Paenibacillus ginsengarvi]